MYIFISIRIFSPFFLIGINRNRIKRRIIPRIIYITNNLSEEIMQRIKNLLVSEKIIEI